MKRKNVLRELLREGKPSLGTHLHSIWPGMVEVVGHSGVFDYVEFQGTYAPFDLFTLENFGRAVELFPHMTSMIKLDQEPRTFLAVRAVGSGIQNLLFADIRTVEDARQAVAAARAETPQTGGIAGVGMRRDVGYVLSPGSEDYVQALQEGVVALMIEKRSAVESLEEILSVGGVDMVSFGYADYAMSIGKPGQWDHPEVKKAQRHTYETALRMGIQPRADIARLEQADEWLEMGVRHLCMGWDVEIIYDWCRDKGGALAKALGR